MRTRLILAAACLPLLAATAQATQPVSVDQLPINRTEVEEGRMPEPSEGTDGAVSSLPMSDFESAVQQILDKETDRLNALQADRAGLSAADARELDKQIDQVKQETEIALLRLQVDRAQALGKSDLAASIEANIQLILNPPSQLAPPEKLVPRSRQ